MANDTVMTVRFCNGVVTRPYNGHKIKDLQSR